MTSINPIIYGYESGRKSVSLNYLFESLDLTDFWDIVRKKYALNGWTRTLDWKAMVKALILKEIWKIGSRRKLAKLLASNQKLLKLCGFTSPPDHTTFSKFMKRVGTDIFVEIFYGMVEILRQQMELGKIVAIDSSLFKAYSRDYKWKKNSDPDAKWGYSATKKTFVFGYKVHLYCDAETEIPLAFKVTSANVYDSVEYIPLLEEMMERGIKPEIILADAGYDTKTNSVLSNLKYGITPIIALNRRNNRTGTRTWEKKLPVKRNSDEWKQLYWKRGSVERVFSRLKEDLDLKAVKVRGIDKVTAHVAISLITMISVALTAQQTNPELATSIASFRY
ncbi:MAG: transposase [Candidatus Hodarchaeales archaeon]